MSRAAHSVGRAMEDLTRLFVVCGKAAEVVLDHAASATVGISVEGIDEVSP